jgi:hypothetical protein
MWYMPLDWVNFVDQEMFTKKYSFAFRYKTMMYMAILQLGSNEIGPVNEIEMIFCVFNLIGAAILNALLFGDIAGLVGVLGKKDNYWQDSLDSANFVMMQIEMGDKDQDTIRDFMQVTNNSLSSQTELNIFFTTISPSLIGRVQQFIYFESLKKNRVVSKIIEKLDRREYNDNKEMSRSGAA